MAVSGLLTLCYEFIKTLLRKPFLVMPNGIFRKTSALLLQTAQVTPRHSSESWNPLGKSSLRNVRRSLLIYPAHGVLPRKDGEPRLLAVPHQEFG